MRPTVRMLFRVAALALVASCLRPSPHTVVTVRDPLALAGAATALDVVVGDGASHRLELGSKRFPVTFTVTGPIGGSVQLLTVDALADGVPVARGRTMAAFPPKKSGATRIDLANICGTTGARGERCALTDGSGFGFCAEQDCAGTHCGDGVVDPERNEECDDGNLSGDDDCTPACLWNTCGDGFRNPATEECDDGNAIDTDACTSACDHNVCGDAIVMDGVEACDDGNDIVTDDCLSCQPATCGDGVTRLDITDPADPDYEACDDANDDPNDTCDRCELVTHWQAEVVVGFDAPRVERVTDPRAVEWDPRGFLVIADGAGVRLFDPALDLVLRVTGSGSSDARAVVPDNRGGFLVADGSSHLVRQIDFARTVRFAGVGVAGGPQSIDDAPLLRLDASLDTPSGLAISGHELFFTTADHLVRRIDPTTDEVGVVVCHDNLNTAAFDCPHGLTAPRGLAVESDGSLVIANTGGGEVVRWTTDDATETLDGTYVEPYDAAISDDGRIFVADHGNHTVQVLTGGVASVLAGSLGTPGYEGDGGPAADALLDSPSSLAVGGGYLWIVDGSTERRIRRVELSTGNIDAPLADDLAFVDGRPALELPLRAPHGLAVDGSGQLYFSDADLHRVFRRHADGTTSVLAGNGPLLLADDTAAPFDSPRGIDFDAIGNLYVADFTRQLVYKVSSSGIVTVAATGLGGPSDVLVVAEDHFYVADYLGSVVVEVDGGVSPIAATSGLDPVALAIDDNDDLFIAAASSSPGIHELPSGGALEELVALTAAPTGLTVTGTDLYFADANGVIGHVDLTSGTPTAVEVAGSAATPEVAGDGLDLDHVSLLAPAHLLAVGTDLYVADPGDGRIRLLPVGGTASTAAGQLHPGDGLLADAFLDDPRALAFVPATATWWIADGGRLRSLSATSLTTRAGYPRGADTSQPGLASFFDGAAGVAFDEDVIYVADSGHHVIRTITLSTWTIEIFAGAEDEPGHVDGDLGDARFHTPMGLAVDSGRDLLLVADRDNHVIRRMDLISRTVSSPVGTPGSAGFSGDDAGPANAARLNAPVAIAMAGDSGCYIADSRNHRVRHVEPGATGITTVVGVGSPGSSGDGAPASSLAVDTPSGVAVDAWGNLYVSSRYAVRQVLAGTDGVAGPDDTVVTVYGAPPRDSVPERATACLTGVAVDPETGEVMVTDACQGAAIRLRSVTN